MPPHHRATVSRAALVKSGPAGTSSGLFGFVLREVSLSLLHPNAASASATPDPTLKRVFVIMVVGFSRLIGLWRDAYVESPHASIRQRGELDALVVSRLIGKLRIYVRNLGPGLQVATRQCQRDRAGVEPTGERARQLEAQTQLTELGIAGVVDMVFDHLAAIVRDALEVILGGHVDSVGLTRSR